MSRGAINYFTFRWTKPDDTPVPGMLVDYDESEDFSDFCEDIYKLVPESDRLKSTVLICRLPVWMNIPHDVVTELCARPDRVSIPDEHAVLKSIRAAVLDEGSFLYRRLRNIQIHLLYSSDFECCMSPMLSHGRSLEQVALDNAVKPILMRFLQQTELRLIAVKSPAILPPLRNLEYLTPSGDRAGMLARTAGYIVIDSTTYHPKLLSEVEIKIREGSVRADKSFYDTYGNIRALLVHRTQSDDRAERHHGVYVDTSKLIASDPFQKKLRLYVDRLSRAPDLIVGPQHHRSTRLIELLRAGIRDKFGIDVPQIEHPNLFVKSEQPEAEDEVVLEAFRRLSDDSEILIVDDAFVTGTRLFQYSQHLRYLHSGYRGRVHFLVGVARPPSIATWDVAKKLLAYRRPREDGKRSPSNTIHAIETVVLPNWNQMECPWCIESGKLENHEAIVGPMPYVLKQRWKMLKEKSNSGMADFLFLVAPGHRPIRLAGGSLFTAVETNQAGGFAAVAGGLQRLRTDGGDVALGPYRHPLLTVLASEEYLSIVYTDSLLRASFFRAAHREELCSSDSDIEKKRAVYVKELICDPSGEISNLTLELLWQVVEGKLPSEVCDLVGLARCQELEVHEEFMYLQSILKSLRLQSEIWPRPPG